MSCTMIDERRLVEAYGKNYDGCSEWGWEGSEDVRELIGELNTLEEENAVHHLGTPIQGDLKLANGAVVSATLSPVKTEYQKPGVPGNFFAEWAVQTNGGEIPYGVWAWFDGKTYTEA